MCSGAARFEPATVYDNDFDNEFDNNDDDYDDNVNHENDNDYDDNANHDNDNDYTASSMLGRCPVRASHWSSSLPTVVAAGHFFLFFFRAGRCLRGFYHYFVITFLLTVFLKYSQLDFSPPNFDIF